MPTTHNPATHTDIAALAAAVVAVTVSLSLDEGIYGLISLIVSLVLIAIILAFVWPSKRAWPQSLALAAALGLAAIPGVGFFAETVKAEHPLKFVVGVDLPEDCLPLPQYLAKSKS